MVDNNPNIIKNQTKRICLPKKKTPPQQKKITQQTSYLGLGSNIGNSQEHLQQALKQIAAVKEIEILKKASLYLNKAWGKTNQQDFLNTAIAIKTTLSPQQLLDAMQTIEKNMGRVKTEKWGPRLIDIDILLYADFVVNTPQLTLPHPYICERSFVLAPLYELNPRIFIPKLGRLNEISDDKQRKEGIIRLFSW